MTIREDGRTEINLEGEVEFDNRERIREFILLTWLKESSNTSYRYFVETTNNGKRIYLERPARLNKGCDFVIYVEDLLAFINGKDKPPSFDNLVDDLRQKANDRPSEFHRLKNLIKRVYECCPMGPLLLESQELLFNAGWETDLILKLVKWFFIEQDITYWNKTGREMLWNAIRNI
jgi:hypothetical protein